MNFIWNEQIIRWFLDASAYTGFHKNLAKIIARYLSPNDTLCDLGCGLGRLDLELAPLVSSVTAVDKDENVIEILRKDASDAGLRNLRAECFDAEEITGSFDVMLMSFFGQSNMPPQRLYRRRLIRVVHAETKDQLSPGAPRFPKKSTVQSVRRELEDSGVGFELEEAVIEFGQPLRSWAEAKLFVRRCEPEDPDSDTDAFLRDNAVRTGREDFPFYLPNPKGLGVFVIDMSLK